MFFLSTPRDDARGAVRDVVTKPRLIKEAIVHTLLRFVGAVPQIHQLIGRCSARVLVHCLHGLKEFFQLEGRRTALASVSSMSASVAGKKSGCRRRRARGAYTVMRGSARHLAVATSTRILFRGWPQWFAPRCALNAWVGNRITNPFAACR